MKTGVLLLALAALQCVAGATAQVWQAASGGGFEIRTAASEDAVRLPEVFATFAQAALRLDTDTELELCESPVVVIHPSLESYLEATGKPWFMLAVADPKSCRIDTQRTVILDRHGGLDTTMLHELHHLAQPDGWERWRAEGRAQEFAGEQLLAQPLDGPSPTQLDALLASPRDSETYLRALATALRWVLEGR